MPWFTSTSSDETAADTLARISRLEWIYIRGVYFPATRRVRDPANWYPSFKAAIDGLTEKKRKGQVLTVGVLSDDSDEHVVGPDMRLGVQEHPRIRLDLYAGGRGRPGRRSRATGVPGGPAHRLGSLSGRCRLRRARQF
ncbi:hypothetical protein GCM10009548_73580 [Streptomyces malaysiensis subsp. malaysiensis]